MTWFKKIFKRNKNKKKNKKKKTHDKQVLTMTKKWINRLLWFGTFWVTWSYALATYAAISGNYTVCENLSKSVVQFIIATILGYMVKSYFETHSEEYNKLVRLGFRQVEDVQNTEDIIVEYTDENFINGNIRTTDECMEE